MKLSVFICNRCLKKTIGDNHAAHWHKLKAEGWVKGERKNRHYCPECAAARTGQVEGSTD